MDLEPYAPAISLFFYVCGFPLLLYGGACVLLRRSGRPILTGGYVCPDCAEVPHPKDARCRYCGSDLMEKPKR